MFNLKTIFEVMHGVERYLSPYHALNCLTPVEMCSTV